MKISNSKVDLYNQCPKKFYFTYVKNLKGDFTSTPLLFGTAIDAALNYILESIKDNKSWNQEQAEDIFKAYMKKWNEEQRLDYFKNEVPDCLNPGLTEKQIEKEVWKNLISRGLKCLDIYIKEVLPQLDQIIHVQHKFDVKNEEEDVFTGVIDFVAKLKDGRTVIFDNKTASAKYPKNRVITSQQLSLYSDQFPDIKLAGYIVLIKNPAKEKGMTHQILIDEIPEETIAASFKLLDETMRNIKEEKFPCNLKACGSFGKRCDYEAACKFNQFTGLIKRKNEENTINKK